MLSGWVPCLCQLEKFCKKVGAERFCSSLPESTWQRKALSFFMMEQSKEILMQGANGQNLANVVDNLESALGMELLEIIQCGGEWKESTEKGELGRFL